MFTIGDFAKLGRVSVRMLRHYDAIGLLTPVVVDPTSGYRFYNAEHLRRLNRVIALKDLGFTLQQVQAILDDQVDVVELRGMLRLRRAQLEAQMTADAARLTGVEARLRMIEKEGHMNTQDVVLKEVAATIVHHGPMDDVMQSLQILARWIEDNGYRPVGYHREVYLDYYTEKADRGVTELQVAVVKD
jgi:DNA-binding transcriptional MerR regulator